MNGARYSTVSPPGKTEQIDRFVAAEMAAFHQKSRAVARAEFRAARRHLREVCDGPPSNTRASSRFGVTSVASGKSRSR